MVYYSSSWTTRLFSRRKKATSCSLHTTCGKDEANKTQIKNFSCKLLLFRHACICVRATKKIVAPPLPGGHFRQKRVFSKSVKIPVGQLGDTKTFFANLFLRRKTKFPAFWVHFRFTKTKNIRDKNNRHPPPPGGRTRS